MISNHHHHHLFLKRPFLPHSARIRRIPRYEVSPHIPGHHSFRVQTQLIHIILHTFSSSLSTPTCTSHPCHHHISTGRYLSIISTFTFHMPKPPQSTTPYPLSHALNPKRLYKSTLRFLSFSDTPHIHLTIIRLQTDIVGHSGNGLTPVAMTTEELILALTSINAAMLAFKKSGSYWNSSR